MDTVMLFHRNIRTKSCKETVCIQPENGTFYHTAVIDEANIHT